MASDTIARSRNTVTVGCKYPSGIVLELDEELTEDAVAAMNTVQNAPIGKRKYFPSGKTFTLNGANAAHAKSPQQGRAVAGWGLTDVPSDFWDAWYDQHKNYPLVVSGAIFVVPNSAVGRDEAVGRKGVLTDIEPRDPRKPAPGIMPDSPKG